MNEEQTQGWRNVNISPEMPLTMLVDFMNILNQRLCNIEDITKIEVNGEELTLTEVYARQSAEQAVAQAQEVAGE